MSRSALLLSTLALAACTVPSAPTPSVDGGDHGLPPAGDGGRAFSLDLWDDQKSVDPTGYALLAGFARAARGQSADLDGDGDLDLLVWREPDGTLVRWYQVGRAVFRPAWVSRTFPDGGRTLGIDVDENVPDDVVVTEDWRANTRVERIDTNFNRVFDFRRTTIANPAAGTQQVIEERDAQERGAWAEVRRFTVSLAADQGGTACDGLSNFPLGPFNSDPFILPTENVGISVDEGPVKCEGANLAAAKKAVLCAVKKLGTCVASSNAELASKVQAQLASSFIKLGCNNPCPGKDASTLTPRMNLRADFHTLSPDEACNVVLHELMHHADVARDPTHDDGVDRIYACSRYCNACVKRGRASPAPSDMDDCVACAGTAAEKLKCGSREKVQGGRCMSNAFCSAGLAGQMPCEACDVKVVEDCSGARADDNETYLCCARCPAAYPTNSNPCAASPTLANTCGGKPPQCP